MSGSAANTNTEEETGGQPGEATPGGPQEGISGDAQNSRQEGQEHKARRYTFTEFQTLTPAGQLSLIVFHKGSAAKNLLLPLGRMLESKFGQVEQELHRCESDDDPFPYEIWDGRFREASSQLLQLYTTAECIALSAPEAEMREPPGSTGKMPFTLTIDTTKKKQAPKKTARGRSRVEAVTANDNL